MERRLSSALITAAREAGIELRKVKNGDIYDKAREIRREILRAAKSADCQIAEFGDESEGTAKRLVICPIDSEMNFKRGYLGEYSVMIGYFEEGNAVFFLGWLQPESRWCIRRCARTNGPGIWHWPISKDRERAEGDSQDTTNRSHRDVEAAAQAAGR